MTNPFAKKHSNITHTAICVVDPNKEIKKLVAKKIAAHAAVVAGVAAVAVVINKVMSDAPCED